MLNFPLLTTFGLGYLRPASGTWGSLPTLALAAALIGTGFGPDRAGTLYHAALLLFAMVFALSCLLSGDDAEEHFGEKDPGQVVADETAGMAIPLLALPAWSLASPGLAAFTLAFAFVAFRVCDIVKLWPARQVQSLGGGIGILLDDLIAGVQALVLVQIVLRLGMPG